MRNCIEYILRDDKTSAALKAVTGPYGYDEITYDLVYQTFLQEKKLWNKDSGRMCVHNIISWHKDEQITPEEALAFGQEFAGKWFGGFQTVLAVHQDREHIHCHMVTNSVSYETGQKLHSTRHDMERMKQFTNEMCRARGLSVAEKGKHFNGERMSPGEVIAWEKDKYNLFKKDGVKSYVWECATAVVSVLKSCMNRENFIRQMSDRGWKVHWQDNRKHITFENDSGQKIRDSNLAKTFHLNVGKEGLENEFIRQRSAAERNDAVVEQYHRQVGEIDTGNVGEDGCFAAGTEPAETGIVKTEERSQSRVVRQSRTIRDQSAAARRMSESANAAIRDAESQSIAAQRERQSEEQRRIDAERRAREAGRRKHRRPEPEL